MSVSLHRYASVADIFTIGSDKRCRCPPVYLDFGRSSSAALHIRTPLSLSRLISRGSGAPPPPLAQWASMETSMTTSGARRRCAGRRWRRPTVDGPMSGIPLFAALLSVEPTAHFLNCSNALAVGLRRSGAVNVEGGRLEVMPVLVNRDGDTHRRQSTAMLMSI